MKRLITTGLLSSTLLASAMTFAAATADLKLIGTITPAACVPNFTGGSTIDYGNIPASSLSATAQTLLPEKTTSLSITCNAPVKFGFKTTDDRSASVITTLSTIPGYTDTQKFGLGAAGNGAKIGAYSMQISKSTPDTGTANYTSSENNGVAWSASSGSIRNGSLMAWSKDASALPSSYTSMVADIRVVAAVDKTSNLPITNAITIDGMTTFEVIYL